MSQLSELLGRPGEGFHERRFLGLALFDLLGTVVLGVLWGAFWKQPIWRAILGMFVTGEGLHLLFGAPTALLRALRLFVN
jgi:hypothetical protein